MGVEDDTLVSSALVDMYSKCGEPIEARKVFNTMHSKSIVSWNSMILGNAQNGSVKKAVETIEGMPYKPNSLIWSTLLSVSKLNGDIKHGELAAKQLIELEPYNAEPYITLSNMYAANGRWKDVATMRSVMNSNKIKKFAAYTNTGENEIVLNTRLLETDASASFTLFCFTSPPQLHHRNLFCFGCQIEYWWCLVASLLTLYGGMGR
ncbi:hypothetical protein E3N88_42749 [Mikania micrantha]|uniref:Pentatricopeptide repeat-containing protein n=1 Tax=Mikania micrantha TaxID=192012 RepID=A0A5N6LGZ6_9ASTR|nr:hypothetical protein E3N88_42749 [Mikania micrantha]